MKRPRLAPAGPEREARQRSDFLAYEDTAGQVADFHATRHTYVSAIVAGGASVKTAQELARHSTPALTIGRYSHTRLHDLTAALESLPSLTPNGGHEETGHGSKKGTVPFQGWTRIRDTDRFCAGTVPFLNHAGNRRFCAAENRD